MPIAEVPDEAKAIHEAFVARLGALVPGKPVDDDAVAEQRAERLKQFKARLDAVRKARDAEIAELEAAVAALEEEGGERPPRSAPKKKRKKKGGGA